MSDNRPTVYLEGENVIYRASGLGSCIKYLVGSSMGYEDQRGQKWDDLLERSADEGNFHEDAVISKLISGEGVKVVDRQDEINIQVIPKVFVRGHQEGLIEYQDGSRQLLEVKSMSTKQFTKWQNHKFGQFERYAWQISSYMQAHPALDVRYIVKRREDGYQTELIIPAGEPPIPLSVIHKKVLLAEKYRRAQELPKCDTVNQWGCPLWYLHDEDEEDEPEIEMTEEMQTILGELAKEYKELKAIEDKGEVAEKARKKINPEILNMLGSKDQAEVEFQGVKYRVTRKKGGGRTLVRDRVVEIIGEERMDEVERVFRYEYPVIRTLD